MHVSRAMLKIKLLWPLDNCMLPMWADLGTDPFLTKMLLFPFCILSHCSFHFSQGCHGTSSSVCLAPSDPTPPQQALCWIKPSCNLSLGFTAVAFCKPPPVTRSYKSRVFLCWDALFTCFWCPPSRLVGRLHLHCRVHTLLVFLLAFLMQILPLQCNWRSETLTV